MERTPARSLVPTAAPGPGGADSLYLPVLIAPFVPPTLSGTSQTQIFAQPNAVFSNFLNILLQTVLDL